MNPYPIALTAGDTVGPELIAQAKKLLRGLEKACDVRFALTEFLSGEAAVEAFGVALRQEDLDAALRCRAILYGNVGTPRSTEVPPEQSPVYSLTAGRRALGACANLRPVRLRPEYGMLSPLKAEITEKGMDILVVRDLAGGMITGEHRQWQGGSGSEASDLEHYTEAVVAHDAKVAFEAAKSRRGRLTSVDKSNVLATGKLWRQTVTKVGERYPDVALRHDYVDHAAMDVLIHPSDYDVIVASNVFGDILSDEIAQLSGAPWLFGSAELARDGRGIYTPNQLHHPRGDALAGQGIVSPYGIFDAVCLLLRYSCGRPDLASRAEQAVQQAIEHRLFTAEALPPGARCVTTDELGDAVVSFL